MAADDRVTLDCPLSAIFRSRWWKPHGPAKDIVVTSGGRKTVAEHLLRGFNRNANVRWMKQALG
jgi:hypothetical protein